LHGGIFLQEKCSQILISLLLLWLRHHSAA